MAAVLHLLDQRRLIDSNGISDGGTLTFYYTGTSTKATIYSDVGLTTPMTNPVIVGSGAAVPDIYLNGTITYRRVITYADGSVDESDPYTLPDYLVTAAAASAAAEASAEAAADSEEAAAASEAVIIAAFLNGDAFTAALVADAITAGLAAAAEGEYFIATGDDIDEVRQYQDVAGVATLIFSVPKPDMLTDQVAIVTAAVATMNDRLAAIGPDGIFPVVFGATGSPMSAGIYNSGVWEFFLGIVRMMLADESGNIAGSIEVKSDSGEWAYSISDRTTGQLLFGIHKWDGVWSYEGQLSGGSSSTSSVALPAIENQQYLRQFTSGCQTLLDGGSTLVHVMFDGDSWLDGKAYGSTAFIERFYASTGLVNAGLGYIGLAAPSEDGTAHGDALASVTITRDNSASWTDLFPSTSVSPGTPQNFPGYAGVQATVADAVLTIACPELSDQTSLKLFCSKGATVEQSWDGGGSYTSVTVAGGSGSTTATINMTGKTDTLKLRVSSGTVLSGLFGLSAASGVVFSNFGSSGSTAEQHASVQANADYQAMMAELPGDVHVAVLQLGLNDAKSSSVTAQACADWIGEVRDGYRTAFPGCDILYSCEPDAALNTGFNMHDLALLLRTDGRTNGCAVLDLQGFFGPVQAGTTYAGYAYASDVPLLGPDDRHPSLSGETGVVNGANVIAQAYSSVFIPIAKGN